MKGVDWWPLVIIAAGAALLGSVKMFANVLSVQRVRNDALGLGHFGAPRGDHTHQGLDLVARPGEPVRSPISGKFVRLGFAYPGESRFRLLVLEGEGYLVKLFYVDPLDFFPGEPIARGQVVGYAQDISQRYGPQMTPHVHIEVDRIVGAQKLNPAAFLRLV